MSTWEEHAACGRADPDLFFGPDDEHPAEKVWREMLAKQVCKTCPVTAECLELGLSLPSKRGTWGVFGGAGEDERQSIRRSRSARERWRKAAA